MATKLTADDYAAYICEEATAEVTAEVELQLADPASEMSKLRDAYGTFAAAWRNDKALLQLPRAILHDKIRVSQQQHEARPVHPETLPFRQPSPAANGASPHAGGRRRWSSRTLVACAAVASLVMLAAGIGGTLLLNRPRPAGREIVLAAALGTRPVGEPRGKAGRDVALTIDSPMDGYATLVVLPEGQVAPEEGQEPIEVQRKKARAYGRFRPDVEATILTVVSPSAESTRIITSVVRRHSGARWETSDQIDALEREIAGALKKAGEPVLAVGRQVIGPERPGEK